MQRILDIDAQLTRVFSDFEDIAPGLPMQEICYLADEQKISQQNYAGLYLIEVRTADETVDLAEWIRVFNTEWEHEDYKRMFTPNVKKKRVAAHDVLKEWMPVYLGKSKNVGARVLEHINLALDRTTFAMKIKARENMSARVFRLRTLALPVANYDVVVPTRGIHARLS